MRPPEASPSRPSESPPLEALVRHTNHVSDNYYAETLLKGLGARRAPRLHVRRRRVARFARERDLRAGSPTAPGLSRATASPQTTWAPAADARGEPWFDAFYRSLPLAGKSGTLHKRMRGTPASGRCRAKTGTLSGVSALAGYCTRGGKRAAFALLMNGVNVLPPAASRIGSRRRRLLRRLNS